MSWWHHQRPLYQLLFLSSLLSVDHPEKTLVTVTWSCSWRENSYGSSCHSLEDIEWSLAIFSTWLTKTWNRWEGTTQPPHLARLFTFVRNLCAKVLPESCTCTTSSQMYVRKRWAKWRHQTMSSAWTHILFGCVVFHSSVSRFIQCHIFIQHTIIRVN